MILILFSNKNYEYQSLSCIKSVQKYLTDGLQVLYFTIGYESSIKIDNVKTVYVEDKNYKSFMYYKPELCLKALDIFPEEQYFFYADSDIIFNKRIDFNKIKCDEEYPLAVFGPHECPFIWTKLPNGDMLYYNENALMNYLNVPDRTIRYQWACFQSFNRKCKDFYEEYESLCKNSYLLNRQNIYFPFYDETPFNVCLWKRNANKSLGFIFLNTHLLETIREVEENSISTDRKSKVTDLLGAEWEYIDEVDKVMFYHGCKNKEDIEQIVNYLLHS